MDRFRLPNSKKEAKKDLYGLTVFSPRLKTLVPTPRRKLGGWAGTLPKGVTMDIGQWEVPVAQSVSFKPHP